MPDGPGGFTQDYSCPALLRIPRGRRGLRVRNCHPLRLNFPGHSPRRRRAARRGPTTPRVRRHTRGLGSSPFARHYWGNHCYFLLLRVLRCFSSPGSPPGICRDDRPSGGRVVPFGNPRINGHLRLPRAYRSLSRPSSPPRAKASTRRPNLLSPWTPSGPEGPRRPLILPAGPATPLSGAAKAGLRLSTLAVLCANMSKNGWGLLTAGAERLAARMPRKWRITDSNR